MTVTNKNVLWRFVLWMVISLLMVWVVDANCQERFYAIQRPKETCSTIPSMAKREPRVGARIRSSVSPSQSTKESASGKGVATCQQDSRQYVVTAAGTSKTQSSINSTTARATQSLRSVRQKIYQEKSTRSGSQSSNGEMAGSIAFQLQLCDRTLERLRDSVQESGEISGTVEAVACAIAKTEGYFQSGVKPNRYHNAGDVRRFAGTKYAGEVRRDRFGYVVFKNDAAGWTVLEWNLQRIVDGTSTAYPADATFADIARAYATDKRWGKSVCKILRVTPQTTLREYLGLAPRILLTMKVNNGTTLMRLFEKRNDLSSMWQMPQMLAQVQ